jgi:transposase
MRIRRTFTKELKRRVVEELLAESTTMAAQCRKYHIAYPLLACWKKDYADGKLNNEPTTEAGYKDKIAELERMIGRLAMDNELLKKALQLASYHQRSNGSSSQIISPSLEVSRGGARC